MDRGGNRCRRTARTARDAARRWLKVLPWLGLLIHPDLASAQEILFSPKTGAIDFMELFAPNAPWRQAASQIAVLGVTGDVVNPSAHFDLPVILAALRERRIALTVGTLPLTGGPAACGFAVEGYSAPGQPLADAERFKAAGAQVRYFSMDEPLYYGHVYNGKNACHSSIADIAKIVAVNVKQVQSIYPGVPFGDFEPVGVPNTNWESDLEQWFDAYEAATGQPLAFFCADIQWNAQWQGVMRKLVRLLRRKNIPLQVIYNGNSDAQSDKAWVAQAVAHFRQYETILPPPALAVFTSWDAHPTHNLPETDRWTMTGLIRQYVAWKQSR